MAGNGRHQSSGGMTPGDRLLKTFINRDLEAFGRLAADLIRSGRQGVLDMALGKCKARHGLDATLAFRKAIMVVAEERMLSSGVEAAFITLPAAILPTAAADLDFIADGVAGCGFFPSWSKPIIIPGWRTITDIGAMPFCDVYRSIEAMAAGTLASAPEVAPVEAMAGGGFMGMIGVRIGSRPDDVDRALTFEEIQAADMAERVRADAAFAAWKADNRSRLQGVVLLRPTAPSRITEDVSALLSEFEGIAAGHIEPPTDATPVSQSVP